MTQHDLALQFSVGSDFRLPQVVPPRVPELENVLSLVTLATAPSLGIAIPLLSREARQELARLFRGLAARIDAEDVGIIDTSAAIASLRALSDDWDGEGAPMPAPNAIARAEELLAWATGRDLRVTEVDADVLGGVAIWIAGHGSGASAWIACMNNGSDTLVFSDNGAITHYPWDESAQQRLVEFATGKHETTRH